MSTHALPEEVQWLGHTFVDLDQLRCALTHRSAGGGADGERLAWIGDAILGAVVTKRLADMFPTAPAGVLTEHRKALVKETALAAIFDQHGLGEYVRISTQSTARAKAEFVEAIFCCIFLEGSYEAADSAAQEMYPDDVVRALLDGHSEAAAAVPQNPRVQVNELVQRRYQTAPTFQTTQTGPSHAPTFRTTATISSQPQYSAVGVGSTKKEAEKDAAGILLLQLAHDQRRRPRSPLGELHKLAPPRSGVSQEEVTEVDEDQPTSCILLLQLLRDQRQRPRSPSLASLPRGGIWSVPVIPLISGDGQQEVVEVADEDQPAARRRRLDE